MQFKTKTSNKRRLSRSETRLNQFDSSQYSTKRSKKEILLVEDDQFFREGLTLALGEEGFQVSEIANAFSLPSQLHTPHLAIIDYYLPEKNGLALAHELRQKLSSRNFPIILISGYPQALTSASQAGFYCLAKPFSLDELLDQISLALSEGGTETAPWHAQMIKDLVAFFTSPTY